MCRLITSEEKNKYTLNKYNNLSKKPYLLADFIYRDCPLAQNRYAEGQSAKANQIKKHPLLLSCC